MPNHFRAIGATTFLSPIPAVMLSCRGTEPGFDKDNLITVAWAGVINSAPPMISVSLRPSRHSYAQIVQSGVFCLNLIDAKALHEARNDVGFFFGLAHYLYRFVYVEKYLSETAQKVKLVGLLFEVEAQLALYAVHAELYPLAEYLADTHLTRCRADQHVEVAGEIVLKRSEPVELCHELLGICAAPQIKRQLESGEVDFVAEVHDLLQLSVLDERCDLCEYLLDRGGIRYLENVDAVVLLVARAE